MGWGGVVCTVIFMVNPTVVLCCVGVGVLTITARAMRPSHAQCKSSTIYMDHRDQNRENRGLFFKVGTGIPTHKMSS